MKLIWEETIDMEIKGLIYGKFGSSDNISVTGYRVQQREGKQVIF